MKKIKNGFWEKIFTYPSFNLRFIFTSGAVLIIVLTLACFIIFRSNLIHGTSEYIAFLGLVIQGATLLLAIFAAYYALRQLVETRFNSLDELGMRELKNKHYFRAFDKWKEAFYIRPEASVFCNLCESLLLLGDYNTFDEYMMLSKRTGLFKKEIFQEISDQIILLYLNSIRHLLVKNQGETEKCLSELVDLVKKDGLSSFQWDFLDLQTSLKYQDLSGECKNIAENLISYLSSTMHPNRRQDFESKNFSSQVNEPIE